MHISDTVYSLSKSSVRIRMPLLSFFAALFFFRGWLSVVSQHRRGKQGRLITFDGHKWNANGLWNHIKVPDGCEWCQKTKAWFACHSVTFRPFSIPILTAIDAYMGWQGGLEEWKKGKKNTPSHEEKREKMGSSGWSLIDNENQMERWREERQEQLWRSNVSS